MDLPPGYFCRQPVSTRLQLATPVGRLLLEACPQGLHRLTMIDPEPDRPCMKESPPALVEASAVSVVSGEDAPASNGPLAQTLAWLVAYFTRQQLPPMPPVCAAAAPAGSFRDRIWRALPSAAPLGTTVTYRDLGVRAGAGPNAARAVGSAMRENPVPLLVPCHRVIRSDGSLGHFAGGKADATKRWLLKHERTGLVSKLGVAK